jgi:histidine ammonia-lyase
LIRLTGRDLSIRDVVDVARRGQPVGVDRGAMRAVDSAAKYVRDLVHAEEPVYGVTTGFGELSTVRVSAEDARTLQRNLVRSHAVGVGQPLAEDVVRAVLLLRANTLAAGRSGVRSETLELLVDMLDRGVLPVIPATGSVGSSGDLAPLAHLALVLIGEGEATYEKRRLPGAEALRAAGLRPVTLEAKEGLSLINGTQVMSAIACLALHDAEVLAISADVIGALSAEALRATDRAWDADLHAARPFAGQRQVATNLRALMEGSAIVASHRTGDVRVQDPYSVRCMPQVHGATRDALRYVREVLEIEINSVTDNPLVFPETRKVVSGGNFHGQPVAIACDLGAIAVAELADISEARIERLLDGARSGLPPFLTDRGGLRSGFMVAQYTAAAVLTQARLGVGPASTHNVPTSAGMEDHNSMGVHAARQFHSTVVLATEALAIEALCAAQGLDFVGLAPAPAVRTAHRAIREVSPHLDEDRPLSRDVAAATQLIANEVLLAAARQYAPDLS